MDAATFFCHSAEFRRLLVLEMAEVAELEQNRGGMGLLQDLERRRTLRVARELDGSFQAPYQRVGKIRRKIGRLTLQKIDEDVLDLIGGLLLGDRKALRRGPRRSPSRP